MFDNKIKGISESQYAIHWSGSDGKWRRNVESLSLFRKVPSDVNGVEILGFDCCLQERKKQKVQIRPWKSKFSKISALSYFGRILHSKIQIKSDDLEDIELKK